MSINVAEGTVIFETLCVTVVLARQHPKVKRLYASSQSVTKGLDSITDTTLRHPQIVFHRFFHRLWKTQRTLQGLAGPP